MGRNLRQTFLATAAVAGMVIGLGSGSAFAGPISPPAGPSYWQFTNLEQVDAAVVPDGMGGFVPRNATSTCAGCSGAAEGNWGIAQVSLIRPGKIINPGVIGNDIDSAGTPSYFVDQLLPAGAQITAMFYGITQTSVTTSGTVVSLKSTGGFIDLYWDDATLSNTIVNIGGLLPSGRTSDSTFTGVTDGTFLARLAFASGIDGADPTTFIQGTIDTSLQNSSGSADSYANLVDVNGDGVIDNLDGAWAGILDSDFFMTAFGLRDFRFSNKIDLNSDWDGATGVLGLTSNDPARAFIVSEPSGLAALGLVMLGLGAMVRRQRKA